MINQPCDYISGKRFGTTAKRFDRNSMRIIDH